jgi:hypothetical protein
LPFIFNFALEYAVRKVQEYQMGLVLYGTLKLLIHADEVNLLGDNIRYCDVLPESQNVRAD